MNTSTHLVARKLSKFCDLSISSASLRLLSSGSLGRGLSLEDSNLEYSHSRSEGSWNRRRQRIIPSLIKYFGLSIHLSIKVCFKKLQSVERTQISAIISLRNIFARCFFAKQILYRLPQQAVKDEQSGMSTPIPPHQLLPPPLHCPVNFIAALKKSRRRRSSSFVRPIVTLFPVGKKVRALGQNRFCPRAPEKRVCGTLLLLFLSI